MTGSRMSNKTVKQTEYYRMNETDDLLIIWASFCEGCLTCFGVFRYVERFVLLLSIKYMSKFLNLASQTRSSFTTTALGQLHISVLHILTKPVTYLQSYLLTPFVDHKQICPQGEKEVHENPRNLNRYHQACFKTSNFQSYTNKLRNSHANQLFTSLKAWDSLPASRTDVEPLIRWQKRSFHLLL